LAFALVVGRSVLGLLLDFPLTIYASAWHAGERLRHSSSSLAIAFSVFTVSLGRPTWAMR
jgi:hypothetical protein